VTNATNETAHPDLAVVGGNPDVEEIAAVTAVLAEVLDELAAEQGRRELAVPSAWNRSQRTVRSPLSPGPGAWRSFSG
jgi:Acyl-CoA carboxylase epsilon subunit